MLTKLQRLLLLTVLFSLVMTGHLPSANYLEGGIWEGSEQSEFVLLLEEEAETESESDELHKRSGSDDGGGDDEEGSLQEEDTGSKASTSASLFADFQPNWGVPAAKSLTEPQIKARNSSLANSSKPLLFLLFHNIKSDLAHIAA